MLDGLIVCAADGTECQMHKKYPSEWILHSGHAIGFFETERQIK